MAKPSSSEEWLSSAGMAEARSRHLIQLKDFFPLVFEENEYNPGIQNLYKARKILSDDSTTQTTCNGCRTLDFCDQIGRATSRDDEQFLLDTSGHPGLRNLSALRESAQQCLSCGLLWYTAELALRQHLNAFQAVLDLSPWSQGYELDFRAGKEPVPSFDVVLVPARSDGVRSAQGRFHFHLGSFSLQPFKKLEGGDMRSHRAYPRALWMPDNDPVSQYSVEQIKTWLEECKLHEECRREPSHLPNRYIDLGNGADPAPRLCESDEVMSGSYVALSYCWGNANTYILTKSRLEVFKTAIDEQALPQTLYDAFRLVRALGIRHLWIDALCIVQDDLEDWQRQSAKMQGVYGRAHLTICASRAASAADGFLHARPPSHHYCGDVTHDGELYPIYMTCRVEQYTIKQLFTLGVGGSGHLRSEPLSLRAWSVQERMLSARTLFFGSSRTIWACRLVTAAEDGIRGNQQVEGLAEVRAENGYYQWNRLTIQYTDYRLTYETDRLPALSGIASRVAGTLDDNYVAGHWERDLVQSITWWTTKPTSRDSTTLAPSWSWVSIKGSVQGQRREQPDPQPIAWLVRVCVSPAGVDRYGTVAPGGYIVLQAPLLEGILRYTYGLLYDYTWIKPTANLSLPGQRLQVKAWIDDPLTIGAQDPEGLDEHQASVKVLVTSRRPMIHEANNSMLIWVVCGLFIEAVEDRGRIAFRRIGAFECHHPVDLPSSCFREVHLY